MKKNYTTPTMTLIHVESSGHILNGSIVTKEVEFKGHSDSYETESFNWDDISFE